MIKANKLVKFILISSLFLAVGCNEGNTIAPGKLAPAFDLKTFDNQRFFLNDNKGKIILLTFWAPWCNICKTELIHLSDVYREYKGRGLLVVGINIAGTDVDGASNTVKQHGITYPMLNDVKGQVKRLYQVGAIPHTVIIDQQQRISSIHRGFRETDLRTIKESIETLIKENES